MTRSFLFVLSSFLLLTSCGPEEEVGDVSTSTSEVVSTPQRAPATLVTAPAALCPRGYCLNVRTRRCYDCR